MENGFAFILVGDYSAYITTQSVFTEKGICDKMVEAKISFAHYPGVIRRLRVICMKRDKHQTFTVTFTRYYR